MTADIEGRFAAQAGLGPAAAEADASVSFMLGRLVTLLEAQQAAEQAAAQELRQVPIAAQQIPLVAGAGTLDQPSILGPGTGYFWAIEYLTAAGFTAGTVNVYLSSPDTIAQSNVRFPFTSAGVWEPSRTAAILQPGDRLVFVAAGITGNVVISGKATQGTLRQLSRFLD